MAQGVTGGMFGEPHPGGGRLDNSLEDRRVRAMTPLLARLGIHPTLLLWEKEFPAPFLGRIWILGTECMLSRVA